MRIYFGIPFWLVELCETTIKTVQHNREIFGAREESKPEGFSIGTLLVSGGNLIGADAVEEEAEKQAFQNAINKLR